jgi:hypothetical protein
LWELSAAAPIAVEVERVPDQRFPPNVERTAYIVVATVIEHAEDSSDLLRVAVTTAEGGLTIDVTGAPQGSYTHVADRVGAVGGTLVVESGRLRAEIPCV